MRATLKKVCNLYIKQMHVSLIEDYSRQNFEVLISAVRSSHHTNSLQTEQKVGWLKKVAINSWFLMM